MRYRELPVVTKIAVLEAQTPGAGVEYQNSLVLDLFKTPGFQLVMAAIQRIEGEALSNLRTGKGNSERLAGAIEASDKIRRLLVDLLPVDTELAEDDPEEEVESEMLYNSGFDIPFPQLDESRPT